MRILEFTTGGTIAISDDACHLCFWDGNGMRYYQTCSPPVLPQCEVDRSVVVDFESQQTLYRFRDGKAGEDVPNLKKNRMRGR